MEDMCTGCLSTDRKLFFIGETGYYHLYTQILNEIPIYDLSQVCVRVCWECRARLRSMQVFKQQVKLNYCNLMQHIPPQAASKLASHSAYNLSYPDIPASVACVKSEVKAEEHSEPEPFASALTVEHSEVENTQEQPLKKKKKTKTKLKSSNKIKVKKKRKKKLKPESDEENNDLLDIEDSIDNNIEESIENSIDNHIDDRNNKNTEDSIDNHIDSSIDNNIEDSIDNNIEERVKNIENNVTERLLKNTDKESKETKENKIKKDKLIVVKRTRNTSPLPDRPQCQECGKVFSSKKTYRYHLNVLHKGQNQYPCPRCGKVYQWKSNLGRHLRSHRAVDDGELHCALCDKSFASVATYRQHLRISRRHVPETDFSFACEACGKRFVNKTRLRDHIDWDHLNRIKFRCQLCDKPFKCHTSLYVHTQNVHVGKERKENLCHVCGKSYQNAAKLKYHITAMHSGETPHRCAACGAAFGWYSSLYRHMREVHHKMKGGPKKGKKIKQARASPTATEAHYVPL